MELGNMMFGNSRGEFEVPRGAGFEDELSRLFKAYAPDEDELMREYGVRYENDTFAVRPYYWGACDCGVYEEEDCKETCSLRLPNFHHKPSGYKLDWYKYPLRDSYANKDLSLKEFTAIIDDCIASVKKVAAENK